MLNFKCIKAENLIFNHQELLDYYNRLETDFAHLKWTYDLLDNENDRPDVKAYCKDKVDNWATWAIHSRVQDLKKPQPGWRLNSIPEDVTPGDLYNTPTELMFGIAKKFADALPGICQMGVVVHPAGAGLIMHYDNAEEDLPYVTMHVPIKTTPQSFWQFEDEEIVLETGSAYILNTQILHGTDNRGDEPRIHLIFRLPIVLIDTIVNTRIDLT